MADHAHADMQVQSANSVESDDVKAHRLAIIEAFATLVKEKRTHAIEARRASGIEQDWIEDENHYDGVDSVNQGSATAQKGRTTTDGLIQVVEDKGTRSTVFLKITRPYVDAAAARVADMLLPTDDRNYAIRPTPKPEFMAILNEANQPQPAAVPQQQPVGGVRGFIGKMFGGAQPTPNGPAPQAPNVLQANQAIQKAKVAAEAAQTQIDDWLVECKYHAEVRKVIEGAAKVGIGILKGPSPIMTRRRSATETPEGWALQMVEKLAPASTYVNHWNFFPDGSCGNDIQRGGHVFECDDITYRRLLELKSDPSYIPEMIDLCLAEGPTSPTDGTRKLKQGEKAGEKDLFQIWYFHGQVTKADMEAAGCICDGKETYPAMATMVNDRVIKVTMSPLDSGEFPYDVMVWQPRTTHWAGVGVARQMRECQRGANASVRNLMDNAGLSSGPQIIIDRSKIMPANKKWELTPRKVWYTKLDEDVDDVRKAFTIVNIDTRQQELMAILQFWIREAEDVTGLPMLLQGQQGGAPDTLGGTEIVNNNGSTVLRRIARTFDDRVTEPHIGRYYEYVLMYGPDECKGDFTIDARGSSALVERATQSRELMQMLGMSLNPAYGLDPELVAAELLKSMRFDPKAVLLTDEKKQEMAQRQPPEDPRITAAKIMTKFKEDQLVAGVQVKKMELDHDAKEGNAERQLKKWLGEVDAQLRSATLTTGERQHLEDVKSNLTGIALKLKTQTDLSMGAHAVDVHKHYNPAQVITPAAEPMGRAPNGEAFAR